MCSSCLFVCLCVCLSLRAITFEWVYIENSLLVWCYILTIPRWSLSIKVIGSRSRSSHEPQLNLVWLVWGQGHTRVKVISRSYYKCLTFDRLAGGLHSTERHSCCNFSFVLFFGDPICICDFLLLVISGGSLDHAAGDKRNPSPEWASLPDARWCQLYSHEAQEGRTEYKNIT